MPISPLAKPRPSTRATTTQASDALAEEQLVAAKKYRKHRIQGKRTERSRILGEQEYSVLWSVSGVRAGYEPEATADPGALLKIGVPA